MNRVPKRGHNRGSYVSNHVHIVFSTKNRLKAVPEDLQPKLWAYMAGIAKNHGMHAVAIGGIEDHAHALINMGPTLCIAKAVQVLKANSSRWMNEHSRVRFEWQEGYFACSVSRSQVPTVMRYIANQKEHHHEIDSAAELELLLKRHGFNLRD
jgi:putative transposase